MYSQLLQSQSCFDVYNVSDQVKKTQYETVSINVLHVYF